MIQQNDLVLHNLERCFYLDGHRVSGSATETAVSDARSGSATPHGKRSLPHDCAHWWDIIDLRLRATESNLRTAAFWFDFDAVRGRLLRLLSKSLMCKGMC